MIFEYKTTVWPEWIDYNGYMRDAYYGLVFSKAIDALQDEVGFNQAYGQRTGCTIYLVEEHKFFLIEVKEGAQLDIEMHVLDVSKKLFHIYAIMRSNGCKVAISKLVQLRVHKKPTPKSVAISLKIKTQLERYLVEPKHQPNFETTCPHYAFVIEASHLNQHWLKRYRTKLGSYNFKLRKVGGLQ